MIELPTNRQAAPHRVDGGKTVFRLVQGGGGGVLPELGRQAFVYTYRPIHDSIFYSAKLVPV